MAKKKAMVKKRITANTEPMKGSVSAMMGQIGPSIPSAMTGQMNPDLIGANIGRAQQIQGMEQSQMVDRLRTNAKMKLEEKKKYQGDMMKAASSMQQPDGTFRNADNELVIGDLKKFQASQGKKRSAKVKKKK